MLVVDPVSTGAVLCHQLVTQRGVQVIVVWSDAIPDELKLFVDPRSRVAFAGKVQHETGELEATCASVRELEQELGLLVVDVMVGCETGVLLGDELSNALAMRGNGIAKSQLRRNKWLQTEAVRDAGLNACGQALANSWDDVERFLLEKPHAGPFKAVVKPVDGAGSEGVSVCDSPEAVRAAYKSLVGVTNVLGLVNNSVLLQVRRVRSVGRPSAARRPL